MSKPIKIYLSQDEDMVKLSFCVTDYFNIGRHMSQRTLLKYICDNWRTGVEGLKLKVANIIGNSDP